MLVKMIDDKCILLDPGDIQTISNVIEEYCGYEFSKLVSDELQGTSDRLQEEIDATKDEIEGYEMTLDEYTDVLNETIDTLQQYVQNLKHGESKFTQDDVISMLENIIDNIGGIL